MFRSRISVPLSLLLGGGGAISTNLACTSGEVCEAAPWALQPSQRVPVGTTYYLPKGCDGSGWRLVEAPEDNDNELIVGADGFVRFTPVVPGRYHFAVGELEHEVTVVESAPFEHYNYYPTSSVAAVGDELWVTHVFDPHLSRIDVATGEVLGTVHTGPWPVAVKWREGMDFAVVAHKAGDTLGIVDLASRKLTDAVWVGDEPADVELSPDGKRAYVSLATQDAIAVVDLEARERVAEIATNSTPNSVVLSEDGKTLFVASFRSAEGERIDGSYDANADRFDIAVVDSEALEVVDYIESVGANINALLIDGNRLHVATTRMVPAELTIDDNNTAFRHTVASYDMETLAEVAAVDIGRQESAAGWAVRPFGMARLGNHLWVVTEGSDLVLGLDATTLEELVRIEVSGRPRSLVAHDGHLYVHGAQNYEVHVADPETATTTRIELDGDPRAEGVAAGQYLYTGHGADGGINHGCGECHVDALTDGNLWNAGVFDYLAASRPMFWLEGTHPIGWEADGADLYSYLYGSPGPTIGLTIDTQDHAAFYDYLAALVPPPVANGWTERDGSMTETAQRGREVFDEVGCAVCHLGPLTTSRVRLPQGTQPEPTDVPSLVGAYRHAFWLLDGSARTLDDAVEAMLPLAGASLDDEEHEALVRYLKELTAREFFMIGSQPEVEARSVASYSASQPIRLTFSHAVYDVEKNLGRITLLDGAGERVDAEVSAQGRDVTVAPARPLSAGAEYEVVIDAGFEAFDERVTAEETRVPFGVAAAPMLQLEGEYVMTINRPGLDFETQTYDYDIIIPIETPLVATPTDHGATVLATLSDKLTTEYDVTIEGSLSRWPALIMATSPKLFGKTFPTDAELADADGDGVADSGSGTLFFRSPGLEAENVNWTITRPGDSGGECEVVEGTHALELAFDESNNPVVDWQAEVEALGYYVTDVDAVPPVGPGMVTGGQSYWVVQTEVFPDGFAGPIEYGVLPQGAVDATESNGGPLGGAELPTTGCIKATVQFTDFSSSVVTYVPG